MTYSLYLYSINNITESRSSLQQYLIKHQFISTPSNANAVKPGNHLMAYINFLGCSPSLVSGYRDTTIVLHEYSKLTAMGGDSIETVRYPECKHPVHEPVKLLQRFSSSDDRWICPTCEHEGQFDQINWRKTAGISKLFIEITSIFPKEAIPSEKLLTLLSAYSKSEWMWFYSRSSI